jgi:FKBP-type peptidyl-prolyl cis-trans isomerase SlyD
MQVSNDAVVSIMYTLTDDEGVIIDSNVGRPALVYLHGHDNIIPGLEKGLEGASAGERRTVDVAPEDAYGDVDEERIFELGKDEFPEEMPLEEGMQFCAETASGEMAITITEVRPDTVVVDANHPLAGMTLHFDIEVQDVRQGTEEELRLGRADA